MRFNWLNAVDQSGTARPDGLTSFAVSFVGWKRLASLVLAVLAGVGLGALAAALFAPTGFLPAAIRG